MEHFKAEYIERPLRVRLVLGLPSLEPSGTLGPDETQEAKYCCQYALVACAASFIVQVSGVFVRGLTTTDAMYFSAAGVG